MSPAPAPNSASCDTATSNGTTTGERKEPLGDKLAKSDGVLCPPLGVDPEIRAPTPEGGNTPVYPAARQPRRRSYCSAKISAFGALNRKVSGPLIPRLCS